MLCVLDLIAQIFKEKQIKFTIIKAGHNILDGCVTSQIFKPLFLNNLGN